MDIIKVNDDSINMMMTINSYCKKEQYDYFMYDDHQRAVLKKLIFDEMPDVIICSALNSILFIKNQNLFKLKKEKKIEILKDELVTVNELYWLAKIIEIHGEVEYPVMWSISMMGVDPEKYPNSLYADFILSKHNMYEKIIWEKLDEIRNRN